MFLFLFISFVIVSDFVAKFLFICLCSFVCPVFFLFFFLLVGLYFISSASWSHLPLAKIKKKKKCKAQRVVQVLLKLDQKERKEKEDHRE